MKIKIGMQAPNFSLQGHDGKEYTLSKLKGSRVLLYFYPKDNTSGCTTQAELLRDTIAVFKKKKTLVFGISTDSIKSHQSFAQKFALPFPLLSDENKKVVKLYGVWGKKNMMGHEYMGIKRTSFLIDENGVVSHVYENVKPKEHADKVLLDLKNN